MPKSSEMIIDDEVVSPLKSLLRSVSWSGRSSPAPSGRPPKSLRLLKPLSISCNGPITGWPLPAYDDSGHPPPTPATSDELEFSRVADHVYLGSDAAARDRGELFRHGITHVLNCAGGACPEYFRGDLVYKTLWLHDSPAEDITSVLYDAFDYLEDVRVAGKVLVHCRRGASRSAALVIAYIMWRYTMTFDEAFCAVRAARAAADPNLGFTSQLLQCQARAILSPSMFSGFRAYRMAPHSVYDPFHLVPKSTGMPVLLDSRFAFLFHFPLAVFVWIGRACEPSMAVSAARTAVQIVRYERARGPIITVNEGSEPPEFCREGISVSTESVVDYDLDYEIFLRWKLPLPDAGFLARKISNEEEGEGELNYTFSSTETASTISTFSPASTLSFDGYNSSPSPSPVTELQNALPPLNIGTLLPPLHPKKVNELESCIQVASKLYSSCISSSSFPDYLVQEEFQNSLVPDSFQLSTTDAEDDASTSDYQCLNHPLLFHWPGMNKVEKMNGCGLDSSSVFMLLAPNSHSCRIMEKTNVLYAWFGKNSSASTISILSESNKVNHGTSDWEKIMPIFLHQVGLPPRVPIQIIKEGEEPEEFLNHLFSFHQRIEGIDEMS